VDVPPGVGLVRLTRRNGSFAGQDVTVSVCPLLYLELIEAVAQACGRSSRQDLAHPGDAPTSAQVTTPTTEQAQASGRLILLAEDNETNRDVLYEQLRLLGYAAEVAEDGAIALEKWRTGRFALLLTDCHMPAMDGFDLTASIRQDEAPGTHLPIIAVTANAMQGETQRCLSCGMDDYLSKPVRLKELGAMLAKWLPVIATPTSDRPELPQHAARSRVPQGPRVVWDANMIGQLVGDNPPMRRSLLEKFLIHTAGQVSQIEAAVQAGDTKSAANVAHTLKSAARIVGAAALSELCLHMETAGYADDTPACKALVAGIADAFAQALDKIRTHLDASSV